LPDLRGRIPIHSGTLSGSGSTYQIGAAGGVESVTLTPSQIPAHTHPPRAGSYGNSDTPAGNFFAASATVEQFTTVPPNTSLNPGIVQPAGGSQPHDNHPPFLAINFIISLFGIYPSQ
jgi:microcystin-dependent protein